jgi:hypothetical protein
VPAFLPIEMGDDAQTAEVDDRPDRIEVVLTNGRRLFVPAAIDPKQLSRLVQALDR